MSLRNVSEESIIIRELRAGSEGDPGTADVVRLLLALYGKGSDLPQGEYLTVPPVGRASGRCRRQQLVQPSDYELSSSTGPRDRAALATWLRGSRPGKQNIGPFTVIYEQEGERRQQLLDLEIRVKVSHEAKPLRPSKGERACAELADQVFFGDGE